MEVFASTVRFQASHVASCPDVDPVLCLDEAVEIPTHVHDQGLEFQRLDASLHTGLGGGWQLSLGIPVERRLVDVSYALEDGAPYDPPYGDIHHRDGAISGLADGSLLLRRYAQQGAWTLGAGLGSTLPLGRTNADPWELTARGLEHEHQQLGSGVPSPTASVDVLRAGARAGAWASGSITVPFLANEEGFEPGARGSLAMGPTWRATQRLQLLGLAEGSWEGAERWDGVSHGGRLVAGGSLGAVLGLGKGLVLQGTARLPIWQTLLDAGTQGEGQFREGVTLGAGVSWTRPSQVPDAP